MLCTWSCQSGEEPLVNGVYLSEAQTGYNKKVTIDDKGASTSLSLRLAMMADNDVAVSIDSKQATLDAYNKKYGASLKMLPEHLYTLSDKNFSIKKGKIGTSDLLNINVLPFDAEIDPSETYAIPISIESAIGADILEPAKSIVLVLDEVIVTNIYTCTSGLIDCPTVTVANPIANMKDYTVEFLIRTETFAALNKHVLSIGATSGNQIFCRYGNAGRVKNELQLNHCNLKLYSPSLFAEKRWNHIAIVRNGGDVIIYIDGIQDIKMSHSYADATNFGNVTLYFQNKSTYSEFRFWSKPRSQSEIINNMYKVNPKTEGLELYWKINEGLGTKIKDHTDKGRDGIISGSGTWSSGQRFPADK